MIQGLAVIVDSISTQEYEDKKLANDTKHCSMRGCMLNTVTVYNTEPHTG